MILEIGKDLEFLRKQSQPVEEFNDELKALVLNMRETMRAFKGVGLAAPQVKILKRIIIVKIARNDLLMINPIMVSFKKKETSLGEGCLSVPNQYLGIKRWAEVKVNFLDINGQKKEITLKGLAARIFQHELDHLNGILIIDRVEKSFKNEI